jgi:hypothetical protein
MPKGFSMYSQVSFATCSGDSALANFIAITNTIVRRKIFFKEVNFLNGKVVKVYIYVYCTMMQKKNLITNHFNQGFA